MRGSVNSFWDQDAVKGKLDLFGGHRAPVGELRVGVQLERPCQLILAGGPFRRQIRHDCVLFASFHQARVNRFGRNLRVAGAGQMGIERLDLGSGHQLDDAARVPLGSQGGGGRAWIEAAKHSKPGRAGGRLQDRPAIEGHTPGHVIHVLAHETPFPGTDCCHVDPSRIWSPTSLLALHMALHGQAGIEGIAQSIP